MNSRFEWPKIWDQYWKNYNFWGQRQKHLPQSNWRKRHYIQIHTIFNFDRWSLQSPGQILRNQIDTVSHQLFNESGQCQKPYDFLCGLFKRYYLDITETATKRFQQRKMKNETSLDFYFKQEKNVEFCMIVLRSFQTISPKISFTDKAKVKYVVWPWHLHVFFHSRWKIQCDKVWKFSSVATRE